MPEYRLLKKRRFSGQLFGLKEGLECNPTQRNHNALSRRKLKLAAKIFPATRHLIRQRFVCRRSAANDGRDQAIAHY
jgi:hypothetical protein